MSRKVLIVDDSPVIRNQVAMLLGTAGFEIAQAADGVQGVQALDADPGIRMVIADVNMPRMNGLDMLIAMKAKHPKVPVLMLTTEGNPKLMQQAKASGAMGWLVKPFKSEQLLQVVKQLAGAPA